MAPDRFAASSPAGFPHLLGRTWPAHRLRRPGGGLCESTKNIPCLAFAGGLKTAPSIPETATLPLPVGQRQPGIAHVAKELPGAVELEQLAKQASSRVRTDGFSTWVTESLPAPLSGPERPTLWRWRGVTGTTRASNSIGDSRVTRRVSPNSLKSPLNRHGGEGRGRHGVSPPLGALPPKSKQALTT